MEVVFVILVIVFVFIIITNAGKKKENDVKNKTLYNYGSSNLGKIAELNASRRAYDDQKEQRYQQIYNDCYKMHEFKSIAEIEEYIEDKRKYDDYYWSRNTIEYKVLMELTRKQKVNN